MDPTINVRFTSGKLGKGRNLLASAFEEDIRYGSQLCVDDISSSGDISVVSGDNKNSIEHPDHCPPSTVVVLFRDQDKIVVSHIFDSPRT